MGRPIDHPIIDEAIGLMEWTPVDTSDEAIFRAHGIKDPDQIAALSEYGSSKCASERRKRPVFEGVSA